MKRLLFASLLILMTTLQIFGATYTVVVYDADGTGTQTKRPTELFVVFKDLEISSGSCARPLVGGVAVTTGQWQFDGKTYYASGSPETGIVTYQGTITSGGSNTITFQNGTCANTPLSAAAMAGFDAGQGAGNWDAQFSFTPKGGSAYTQNVKAMLTDNDPNSNTFGDCKNNFWQAGPVVTTVIVQDCTSASKWDFGWHWTGGVMIGGDGNPHTAPYTGNCGGAGTCYASIHPYAIVHFYPVVNSSTPTIFIEGVWENAWTGRGQDQNFDAMAFKAFGSGASLSTVYSRGSNFTMIWGTNYRKTGWSGPALGTVRNDLDFDHLRQTHAIPYYDLTSQVKGKVSTSSTSPPDSGESGCATPYSDWALAGKGDFGDTTGGLVAIDQDYASNCEGAPMQREHLLYLYNMNAAYSADGGNAGTANGEGAKAWMMLTGTKGATDGSLTTVVAGGGGVWGNAGNIPFHARESRTAGTGSQTTSNFFFVPAFDSKDAAGDATCTNAGTCDPGSTRPANDDATGRMVSRHTHSEAQFGPAEVPFPSTAVGTITTGGWGIGGCNHWQDWVNEAYLLTGSYYYLQEIFAEASFCAAQINGDTANFYGSHGFFAYSSPTGGVIRELAWSVLAEAKGAFAAPDNSPEKALYTSYVKSNAEVQEGVQNLINGVNGVVSTLTPTTIHPNCDAGAVANWNRWDFGRCGMMSTCSSPTVQNFVTQTCVPKVGHRHESVAGACPAGSLSTSGDNTNQIFVNSINVQTSCGISSFAAVSGGAISTITVQPGGTGSGCTGASTCTIKSNVGSGATCSITNNTTVNVTAGGSGYVASTGNSFQQQWMQNYLGTAWGQARLLGISQTAAVMADTQKQALEYALDSTANFYLLGNYLEPLANGGTNGAALTACASISADPFFSNYATWMTAVPSCVAAVNTFDPFYATSASCSAWTPNVCGNHAYQVVARAAISTAPYFGTSSSDANCPSGTCLGSAAWSKISDNSLTPYFHNAATLAMHAPCSNSDFQVKFALDSESSVSITACNSLSPSSATINTSATQVYSGSCTFSDSSTGACPELILSSTNTGVATVSAQTATGVSAGSATISATDNGFACGNTSALTVNSVAVVKGGATGMWTGLPK